MYPKNWVLRALVIVTIVQVLGKYVVLRYLARSAMSGSYTLPRPLYPTPFPGYLTLCPVASIYKMR